MRKHRNALRLLAAAAAFSLVGAACSMENASTATESTGSSNDTMPSTEQAPALDTGAAALQRDLTSLLSGHEYLAGIALYTAVQAGGDLQDPTVRAAVGSLDANSKALADAVASVYGDDAGQKFLKLWRAHIGFFVDYTLGKATGDAAMAKKAEKDLDGYRQDFGALIEGATEGGLTQDQVADVLDPHVTTTKAAIDSVVTGKADAFDKLQEAAGHMPHIATALATAIATQFPDKF